MNAVRTACCVVAGVCWPTAIVWFAVMLTGEGASIPPAEFVKSYLIASIAIAATLTALCVKDTPK